MKYIWCAHFHEIISTKMQFESIFLCLHTRLRVNKKFPNFHYIFEINVNVCLLCAHFVMTSVILHSRRPADKNSVMHLVFMFEMIFVFAFWGAEKHVIHIASFRPTRYVLKSFRYLDVRNRVRNWNKVKNYILVGSKLQLCQLEIPIFIHKIMSQSTLIISVSYLFCEFIRVTNWNDCKTIILVQSSFQIPQWEYWFIFKVNQCQRKHVFS